MVQAAALSRRTTATALLLQLERAARHAEDLDALRYCLVNETRRLIQYRQAVFLQLQRPGTRYPYRVDAVSNVPNLDRNAPFIAWIEDVARTVDRDDRTVRLLRRKTLPDRLAVQWDGFMLPDVLWVPLPMPGSAEVGALWLSREGTWTPTEISLLEQLGDTYGHAWHSLQARAGRRPQRAHQSLWWRRWAPGLALIVCLGLLAVPVPQTALAPAEVVPKNQRVVAAPIDGVISTFHVQPNASVSEGDPLFSIEDDPLRSARDIAEKSLSLAEAELLKARQTAFADARSKADVALLEARVALRQVELFYSEERLARAQVLAPRDGIAVFADVNEWLGRPVTTGERILTVAPPTDTELGADLAVSDAIALTPGTRVTLFLSANPLEPVAAELVHASYEARMTEAGVLSYRLRARFVDEDADAPPRVGLKGTAKLWGQTVPLGVYLFRRPIATLRQWLGL